MRALTETDKGWTRVVQRADIRENYCPSWVSDDDAENDAEKWEGTKGRGIAHMSCFIHVTAIKYRLLIYLHIYLCYAFELYPSRSATLYELLIRKCPPHVDRVKKLRRFVANERLIGEHFKNTRPFRR